MAWEIEVTEDFQEWWAELSEEQRIAVTRAVTLLEDKGPALGRPQVDSLSKQSRHSNMKELRIRFHGDAYRVLFAFDPRQVGILLLGGRKSDQKWYKKAVEAADKLYDEYLDEIRGEGLIC